MKEKVKVKDPKELSPEELEAIRKFCGQTPKRVEFRLRYRVICKITQFWGGGRRFAQRVA